MVSAHEERCLRAVNYRLKNTAAKQLPKILPSITAQLASTDCHLTTTSEATWLKTRISSLLQDRTIEGRWSAVVLVKTALDLYTSNAFAEDKDRIGAWIRGLIEVLKKPGPAITKKYALVAITRAFMLTWDHPTLVREITTPTLPTFLTACLQQFQGTPFKTPLQCELAEYAFESFAQLLSRHPTVFRSFANQIRNLAIAALCNAASDDGAATSLSPDTKASASRILVLLHQCAQKGGGAGEWEQGMNDLITSLHATADLIFRAVTEDWQSVAGVQSTMPPAAGFAEQPGTEKDDKTGFLPWSGLSSGVERLQSQLQLLQSYLETPTAASVKMPVGKIVDLLTRVLYVQVPRAKDPVGNRYNPQVSREEREQLLTSLPAIHIAAFEAMMAALDRLDDAALPLCSQFLDLIVWVFEAESFDLNVRTIIYEIVAQILSITGPSLTTASVKSLDRIIKSCCKDLLPQPEAPKSTEQLTLQGGNKSSKGSNGVATSHSAKQTSLASTSPLLYDAASNLLPELFSKLPTHMVSKDTRTQMDRVAVLTNHVDALAASVLNPAPQKPSLLPILAAIAPEIPVTEAILRPRMPVILSGEGEGSEEVMEEDEDVEESIKDGAETAERIEPTVAHDWSATVAGAANMGVVEEKETLNFTAKQPETSENIAMDILRAPSPMEAAETSLSVAKRSASGAVEAEFSTKKARLGNNATQSAAPKEQVPLAPQPADVVMQEAAEESGDEDGSDFEIPTLVMRTGESDDEGEED